MTKLTDEELAAVERVMTPAEGAWAHNVLAMVAEIREHRAALAMPKSMPARRLTDEDLTYYEAASCLVPRPHGEWLIMELLLAEVREHRAARLSFDDLEYLNWAIAVVTEVRGERKHAELRHNDSKAIEVIGRIRASESVSAPALTDEEREALQWIRDALSQTGWDWNGERLAVLSKLLGGAK